jgi:hypothetical protein
MRSCGVNTRSEQGILAEVIVRTWQDDAQRARLLADPATVLRDAGMQLPDGVRVTVLEDTATVMHVSVPHLLGADEVGRDAFLAVLASRVPLPAGVELRLHQSTESDVFVVLPMAPAEAGQLGDEALQSVIGGFGDAVGLFGGNGGNGGNGGSVGQLGGNGGIGGSAGAPW